MSVPVGFTANGISAGVWLYAGFLQEGNLISVGYGIEQLLQARTQPAFKGKAPPEPPDAGICAAPLASKQAKTKADLRRIGGRFMLSTGGSAHPPFTDTRFGHPFFYDSDPPATALEMVAAAGFRILVGEFTSLPTSGPDKGKFAIVAERG
jgi:hypothetical protein